MDGDWGGRSRLRVVGCGFCWGGMSAGWVGIEVRWRVLRCPQRALFRQWAAIAAATFLFQAGYPSIGTSETGAIYHHAALPFLAFSTAAALHSVHSRWYGGWIGAVALTSTLLGTT